jgi:hypothetical protein
VIAVCEQLGPEKQARFDFQYLRANAAAKELAERHEELSLSLLANLTPFLRKPGARRLLTARLMPLD